MSDTPATIRREWRDMKRERDEALRQLGEARDETKGVKKLWGKAERDLSEARRQRGALAKAAKPVVDRLWETGQSQPAEVIRLGELVQEALAAVGDGREEA